MWLWVEVDKRHFELMPFHPDQLEAGRCSPGQIAIRNACGLGNGSGRLGIGSGRQDEHQGCDGYYGDTDTSSIL